MSVKTGERYGRSMQSAANGMSPLRTAAVSNTEDEGTKIQMKGGHLWDTESQASNQPDSQQNF